MKATTALYIWAIMPDSDLSLKIHAKRIEFFERYNFCKALKPPVHFTLYDPFQLNEEKARSFEDAISQLQNWADYQSSFQIDLHNYSFFENPKAPVVFIGVVKNTRLHNLHANFLKELPKYMPTDDKVHPYNPHITIGYRDITPDAFPSIKKYYSTQTFGDSFTCNSFHLWKHDSQNWQVLHTFHLNGINVQLTLF